MQKLQETLVFVQPKVLAFPQPNKLRVDPQNHKKPKRNRRGELQSLKNLQSFLLQKVQKNQRQNQHPLERRLLPKQQQVRKGQRRVLQRELRKLGKLLLHREEAVGDFFVKDKN